MAIPFQVILDSDLVTIVAPTVSHFQPRTSDQDHVYATNPYYQLGFSKGDLRC